MSGSRLTRETVNKVRSTLIPKKYCNILSFQKFFCSQKNNLVMIMVFIFFQITDNFFRKLKTYIFDMYVCYNLIRNLKCKHTYFYFDDSSWSFFALRSFELLLQDHTRNLYQCCYCCCSRLSKSHLYVRQSMLEGHRDKTGDQLLFVRRSKKSESSRVKILRLKKNNTK